MPQEVSVNVKKGVETKSYEGVSIFNGSVPEIISIYSNSDGIVDLSYHDVDQSVVNIESFVISERLYQILD